jgi:hypothetical protein
MNAPVTVPSDDAELVDLCAVIRGQALELAAAHRDAYAAWFAALLGCAGMGLMLDAWEAKLLATVAGAVCFFLGRRANRRARELAGASAP